MDPIDFSDPESGLPLEAEAEAQEAPDNTLEPAIYKAIWDIVRNFETRERSARTKILAECKKHEYFYRGIQRIFWGSGDWFVPDGTVIADIGGSEEDLRLLNRIVNIIRPNIDSAVAALSAAVPNVRNFPANADSPEDIITAKTFDNIGKLIQSNPDTKLVFMEILFRLLMDHYVAIHTAPFTSEKNGKAKIPVYGTEMQEQQYATCSNCGMGLSPEDMVCPQCGVPSSDALMESVQQEIPIIKEYKDVAKTRAKFGVYGPVNVKIPLYCTEQDETMGYLILEKDVHVDLIKSLYPEIADQIVPGDSVDSDRWARIDSYTAYSDSLCTVRRVWLRPWTFSHFDFKGEGDILQKMLKLFPDGVCAVFIGDVFAEAYAENFDDVWTLTKFPYSRFIWCEPPVSGLIPIQEMRNTLINLGIETIEHGVAENFADPNVFDFDAYAKSSSKPGTFTPILKAVSGQPLEHSFASVKPAILSQEYPTILGQLDQDAQFELGVYPALVGGQIEGGSKTFSEYSMSGAKALQRLSTFWFIANNLWAGAVSKAIVIFIQNMLEDENLVVKNGSSFVNIWIRQSELTGKVGKTIVEATDQFPLTPAQKRETMIKLIETRFEPLMQAIMHPENMDLLKTMVGIDDLYIPGSEDRDKQLLEIAELMKAMPMPNGMPSVPTEPQVDNAEVHVLTCQAFLASPLGQDLKLVNPAGYQNIVAHMTMHMMQVQPPAQPAEGEKENVGTA